MDAFLRIPATHPLGVHDALAANAQACVLDIASVEDDALALARKAIIQTLYPLRPVLAAAMPLYLQVHPLSHPAHFDDLVCAAVLRADGIVLPDCKNGMDVTQLAARLSVIEVEQGIPLGSTRILAEVAHIPLQGSGVDDYIGRSARLTALMVAPTLTRKSTSLPLMTWQMMRMMTLLAGNAAGLPVIDAASSGDAPAYHHACIEAAEEGFSGKIAVETQHITLIQSSGNEVMPAE